MAKSTFMPMPTSASSEKAPTHDELRLQIFDLVRQIPAGHVMNYGAIGAACKPPISGYICGRLMRETDPGVPWWRIIAKDGSLPAAKRLPTLAKKQRELLESEGIEFGTDNKVLQKYFLNNTF